MVKILANGDIVADDDPRAAGRSRPSSSTPRPRQGGVQHADPQEMQQGAGGGVSMFGQLNQRLLQAGVPRFNAGQYAIEPIVSVGMLLAFLLLGFKGLILGGVLFLVSKWSESGGGTGGGARRGGGEPDNGKRFGGQGHTLGR